MSFEFTAKRPRGNDFRADSEGMVHVSMHIDVWLNDDWQADFDLDLCPSIWNGTLKIWGDELCAAAHEEQWVMEHMELCRADLIPEINRALAGGLAAYMRAQTDYNMSE